VVLKWGHVKALQGVRGVIFLKIYLKLESIKKIFSAMTVIKAKKQTAWCSITAIPPPTPPPQPRPTKIISEGQGGGVGTALKKG